MLMRSMRGSQRPRTRPPDEGQGGPPDGAGGAKAKGRAEEGPYGAHWAGAGAEAGAGAA